MCNCWPERMTRETSSARQLTLYGDLETILAWAADQGGQRREAMMGFPAGALSVAVNARAGMADTKGMVQRPVEQPQALNVDTP